MNLIGISGKKGSGKNTVADLINERLDGKYKMKAYADKLKEMAAIMLGCPVEKLNDQEFKKAQLSDEWFLGDEFFEKGNDWDKVMYSHLVDKKLTPRDVLQMLGDNTRGIHPNVWVNSLFADWTKRKKWIVTDVRFPNEYEAIKERGGIIIRVNRKTNSKDTHQTETALDYYKEFDYVIGNNGTMKQLNISIDEMFKELEL
jgi:dephospho-CoA kinase